MPERFGEMKIENASLVDSNGKSFVWSGIQDVTTELENENCENDTILLDRNLECSMSFEIGPKTKKMFDRVIHNWKAKGPIRKRLRWKLIKKFKFTYYFVN